LRQVSVSTVFYHTHERFLTHQFQTLDFNNDFAEWTARALQEQAVAEKLSAVELLDYTSLEDLRNALIKAIESSSELYSGRPRTCPPGDEFHFCQVKSFIMPTGMTASSLEEFAENVTRCTNSSIFFHLFEARLRLEHKTNDFSLWLNDLGERRLADEIDRLDPHSMSLEQLKQQMYILCRRRLSEI
jgi:hypothetical protein